ncbi:archaetidylserine decarboxylase [Methylomarinum sp. Ch1-1]|uniref:Phosphatidylserine decarboxylase proenzyme n=1 Tax=Methylomarinum roseum TaxID=3067653 RepID=A0AAU7NSL2_9GAMM|nr:archaetidylserine decarboxylase [Methylomarinum sp. Ch1-1]MDP4520051.1 archaetidylserine decarboxylase [Methylomarinum sp. Ch1-1]
MTIKEALTTYPQYILPHHFLSKLMAKLTHAECKIWKNLFIRLVIKLYHVDMNDAKEQNLDHFASFNHFFTRELKPGARTFPSETNAIACPADGAVSQAGIISDGQIFQAKGKSFSAIDLLGGDEQRAEAFADGVFSTIYLSPKDYHRLHMPLTGTLKEMVHIPGRLFSVNNATTNTVPGLFARNERVACIFDTDAGPMALVLVGAIFVSSVETVWHGVVTPPTLSSVRHWDYQDDAPTLEKGQEMGRFNMGSTIIVLFGKDVAKWKEEFVAGKEVKLGETIGSLAQ